MPVTPPDLPRRSPTIYASRAKIESSPGPLDQRYAVPLDFPGLYRWAPGNTSTRDGITTLQTSGAGTLGMWILVSLPEGASILGDDLVDGNQTIHVTGGFLRTLPAATLTGNATITLGTTNAREGYPFEIIRRDVGAFTVAIVNGGAGGGTLCTLPVSQRARFVGYFNGTDFLLRDAHTML